jgi:GTP-binding protein EngB required for normal cell division
MTTVARLDRVLDRLAELAGDEHRGDVDELRARAGELRLRVLVAGEAKRGKSTLINALLGDDVLPTGVVPVTAIATTIRVAADRDSDGRCAPLLVMFRDGRVERRPVNDLAAVVTEHGNPGNTLGVDAVTLTVAGGPLAGLPLELVDTPGVGSVHEHNTAAAHAAYEGLDAVVVVLGVDPPITAAERDLLTALAGRAVATFIVLSKVDRLDRGELAEAVAFTESVIAGAGVPAQVWPVAARERDDGFDRFATQFAQYLAEHGAADATRALQRHAWALAGRVRDEVALAARTLELADADGQARVAEFGRRLAALADQAAELDDRLAVAQRRLRRRLDAEAARLLSGLADETRALVVEQVGGLDDVSAIEAQGERATAEFLVDRVQAWRAMRGSELESDLAGVVAGIEAARAEQLARLRDDARTLLDLQLDGPGAGVELAEGHRFWFSFADPPAWELPGADLLRRHGPGAARRARDRVVGRIPELVDRQVGRARADLQQRLAETVRTLAGQLRREHRDLLDRLAETLERTRAGVTGDRVGRDATHRDLLARLTAVTELLDETATGAGTAGSAP